MSIIKNRIFNNQTGVGAQVLLKNVENQYPESFQCLLEFLRISFHKTRFFLKVQDFYQKSVWLIN